MGPELNREAMEELFARTAEAVREVRLQAARCLWLVARSRRLLDIGPDAVEPDEQPEPDPSSG
jgi:hypothetical protein